MSIGAVGYSTEKYYAGNSKNISKDSYSKFMTTGVATQETTASDNEKTVGNATIKESEEKKDWRELTNKEWDKLLEGVDKKIEASGESICQMMEMHEEVIFELEEKGISKFQEVQLTDDTTVGISQNGETTECASVNEDENKEKVWTVTAFTENGIICNKCQNGKIINSWEINHSNPDDAKRVQELLECFDKEANLKFCGSKEFWEDFLNNKISIDDIVSEWGVSPS